MKLACAGASRSSPYAPRKISKGGHESDRPRVPRLSARSMRSLQSTCKLKAARWVRKPPRASVAHARRTRAYRCKNRCTTPRGLFAGHRNILTTNLGVGGSNPSGRANKALTLVVFFLLQLSPARGISAEEPPRNHHQLICPNPGRFPGWLRCISGTNSWQDARKRSKNGQRMSRRLS